MTEEQRRQADHYRDLQAGTLLDYDVYWIDLNQINRQYQPTSDSSSVTILPDFRRLYRASEAFGVMDLTIPSFIDWAKLLVRKKYIRNKYKHFAFIAT